MPREVRSAGKPADVFYVDAADFADWVAARSAAETSTRTSRRRKFKDENRSNKNLLNTFKYQGHYYGFPKDWSSLGMEVKHSGCWGTTRSRRRGRS